MTSRTTSRQQLLAQLAVHCAETGQPIGRIVDISLRGMRLETDAPASLHAVYQLLLEHDGDVPAGQPWRIDARCMWTGHDIDPPRHLAGFEFAEVAPRQREMLVRLIRRHGCS
jgi:hypothetical protein